MPPKGPEHPGCNCRPLKPCFESIQKMLASAQKTRTGDALGQHRTGSTEVSPITSARERDMRDVDPELDKVPTVDCRPPQQATIPTKNHCREEKQKSDTGKDIEQEFKAQAAKTSCPCDACLEGAMFEDCAHPYIEIERKYLEAVKSGREPSKEFTPDDPPPHDCHQHRDRPRDRAPGDPESDFEPKTCGECLCCLAFRPHPPATLATPDLYRTCGLPKRFKYPAWFKGYGNGDPNPMYRTTYSDFGRYAPNVHTVPTVYHPIDSTWSNIFTKIGPYRDRSLRTTGSIWDAYTYYDF